MCTILGGPLELVHINEAPMYIESKTMYTPKKGQLSIKDKPIPIIPVHFNLQIKYIYV